MVRRGGHHPHEVTPETRGHMLDRSEIICATDSTFAMLLQESSRRQTGDQPGSADGQLEHQNTQLQAQLQEVSQQLQQAQDAHASALQSKEAQLRELSDSRAQQAAKIKQLAQVRRQRYSAATARACSMRAQAGLQRDVCGRSCNVCTCASLQRAYAGWLRRWLRALLNIGLCGDLTCCVQAEELKQRELAAALAAKHAAEQAHAQEAEQLQQTNRWLTSELQSTKVSHTTRRASAVKFPAFQQ